MVRSPTCPDRRLDFPVSFDAGGLVAPTQWSSAAGVLFPIAPCGLTSLQSLRQQSSFSLASASDKNQRVFRHSARSRPLNASMKALSVGLPGREKSSVTLF